MQSWQNGIGITCAKRFLPLRHRAEAWTCRIPQEEADSVISEYVEGKNIISMPPWERRQPVVQAQPLGTARGWKTGSQPVPACLRQEVGPKAPLSPAAGSVSSCKEEEVAWPEPPFKKNRPNKDLKISPASWPTSSVSSRMMTGSSARGLTTESG